MKTIYTVKLSNGSTEKITITNKALATEANVLDKLALSGKSGKIVGKKEVYSVVSEKKVIIDGITKTAETPLFEGSYQDCQNYVKAYKNRAELGAKLVIK